MHDLADYSSDGAYWGFCGHLWSWDYALGALWNFVERMHATPTQFTDPAQITFPEEQAHNS